MAQNPNIDDATRARAMKSVAGLGSAKPRIVGKKELEDSGLSLRDFLNKERGLTRRRDPDPTAGEAKDRKAQAAADTVDPGKGARANDGGEAAVRRQDAEMAAEKAQKVKDMESYVPRRASKLSDVTRPGTGTHYENSDTSDMQYKKGGSVSRRGDGIAQRGRTKGRYI